MAPNMACNRTQQSQKGAVQGFQAVAEKKSFSLKDLRFLSVLIDGIIFGVVVGVRVVPLARGPGEENRETGGRGCGLLHSVQQLVFCTAYGFQSSRTLTGHSQRDWKRS